MELIGLSQQELNIAKEAVQNHREQLRLLAISNLPKPSYKNTISALNSVSLKDLMSSAILLGYDFFIWDGWIYPTIGEMSEKYQIALADTLDKLCISCKKDISDQDICWECV